MLTALILVCSLAVTPDLADRNHKNALDVLRAADEFSNPARCAMQGQAYLAQTAIARNLTKDESVKIICIATATVDKTKNTSAERRLSTRRDSRPRLEQRI